MEIRRITQTSDPLYEQAMALYTISFPFHEQRQALSQSQILQQDAYHFDVICDNGEFVGEILYWDIADALYIEHFCVSPAMRNRHYGQRILSAYQSTPLILEIDPPVDALCLRRKGFYERCGFTENPYAHVHPPLSPRESGAQACRHEFPGEADARCIRTLLSLSAGHRHETCVLTLCRLSSRLCAAALRAACFSSISSLSFRLKMQVFFCEFCRPRRSFPQGAKRR